MGVSKKIKVGETWFIRYKKNGFVSKQTIDELTKHIVGLRDFGNWKTRYSVTYSEIKDIEFIEKVKP